MVCCFTRHPSIPSSNPFQPIYDNFRFISYLLSNITFVGLAYQGKEDIVFRFNIEYSRLRDFGP